VILRPGRDADAQEVIDLISACWAEYPGCLMDLDGENPELRALASHFANAGGALWVAEDQGRVCGMVAVKPSAGDGWELCRMYVAADRRGSGVAGRLLQTATDHARAHGATRLTLWSDTRFERAHRFYERHGFVRQGPVRPLFDISNSLEFGYAKPIAALGSDIFIAR
jgi:GNAT superfamily N-acetyltransferase